MKGYIAIRNKLVILSGILLIGNHSYSQEGLVMGPPRIAYWKYGSQSPIIIVLHGGPAAAHNYLRPEWDVLSSSGTLIYYDQRGCGKSENAECYSWNEHVNDLKRLINQVARGKKVILAGSSWGSTLALLYAYSFPSDIYGLILSGTYNWIGKGEPARSCADYLSFPLGMIKDTGSIKNLKVHATKETPTPNEKSIEVHNVSHSMTSRSMASAPILDELKKVDHPILLFKGAGNCQDVRPAEGADIYNAILLNVRMCIISDACHDPWMTNTKEFFSSCVEFIDSLRKIH